MARHDSVAHAATADAFGRGAAAPVRARADPRLVLADRVEELYGQMWLGILATFAIGAIATFEFWDPRMRDLVLFWWGLVLIVASASAGLLYAYRRSETRAENPEQWLRWLAIAALASGANWGFAGAVFFPSHTDEQQVFLAFLLAGMMSGGIPVYAASWPIFALYAGGIVVPFTYVLATFGNRLFIEIALLVPMFYAINVAVAYRLTQVFHAGYRLRHAYGKLTEDYSVLNKRLERQLGELDEARRQVEASGRKLSLFAERAPIAVLEISPEGIVTQVNPGAELLFGWAAEELAGRHVQETLVLPEYRAEFAPKWEALIASREPVAGLKIRSPRRDGLQVVCEWTVTPLVNAEGELIAVIAQGQDVTRELEAERLKKEFTSTLSHELRTPLTSIIGSLQLINSGVLGELPQDVGELTSVAERNGSRLLDLINDLLDIEKIESGKLTLVQEVFRLGELLREAMVLNKAFGERFKVRFELAQDGNEPASDGDVRADRKRLLQVMTNLLSNAAKFSPENGVVEVSLQARGSALRVGVHDRGPGIPESFRSRIFGRFAQADSTTARQKGGTGLGLAISKRLVEMMHGRIGFESREGGGTTFWFELPRHVS
ncbi:MAG TPA: PAS domain-containing sensor histidine kinase [Burkholderiales bacterium]|nr:PAS domain-containing sensor histidine kinase [Burkholderiales bacterium]